MTALFIVSQHRTGSTLVRNILNANSDVAMAHEEMNIFEPFRANTLDRLLGKEISSINELFAAIDRGDVYGAFWKKFEESGIDREQIKSHIGRAEMLNEKTIIASVLEMLKRTKGARHAGVKYPVHFSKLHLLREWFPGSKVIFLFRNPKAMLASKLNDPATQERKKRSLWHYLVVHYGTLLFFSMEFRRSVRVFLKHQNITLKINYEELVLSRERTVMQMCEYCGIDYEPEMLTVTGKASSFGFRKLREISPATVKRYRVTLTRFDQWVIDLITRQSYEKIK